MPALYQRSRVAGALVLSNGSWVCAGDFSRAEGLASGGLVRYLPSGQPDVNFINQTRLNTWRVEAVRETVGGKLFVQFTDTARVGGQLCASLVRLLPNGRRDSTFRSPAVPWSLVDALLALPDGSLLIAPRGQGLLRLLPNGNPDAGFYRQYGSTIRGGDIYSMVRQTDGKVLIGGSFAEVQGTPQGGLTRMLPNGNLDVGYRPAVLGRYTSLTLQPDGKLLVKNLDAVALSSQDAFFRLHEATGAHDNTFQLATSIRMSRRWFDHWPEVQVQANGSILLAADRMTANVYYREGIVRLTSTGAHDPSWSPGGSQWGFPAESIQLLPSGNVLLTTLLMQPFVGISEPVAVAALDGNTGSCLPNATPRLQKLGFVTAMARQADGKIVVLGVFTEFNGQPSNGLVRLHPNGALDASYGSRCALFPWASWAVEQQLALQADGKLLVTGFSTDGGFGDGPRLVRLLSSGCSDSTFNPGYSAGYPRSISLQSDGRILLMGRFFIGSSSANHSAIRLNPDGSIDPSFSYASPPAQYPIAWVAQPDGSSLMFTEGPVANTWRTALQKLDAAGNVVAGYASVPLRPSLRPNFLVGFGRGFVRDAAGRQLIFGDMGGAGAVASPAVVRMLPNGIPDSTFRASFFGSVLAATAVAIQPNGSVLVGCEGEQNIQRLLPTGSFDPLFDFFQGPRNGVVNSILVEPGGGILIGGDFQEPGTGRRVGMLRLLDPNVLAVNAQQPTTRTAAYPVPAHGQLHLALDATARPQQVQLLDGRGRVVLTQATPQPDLTLNTEALAPGLYLLRVQYAGQTATRRVVLE